MLSKLASPVELQLIVEVANSLVIIYRTTFRFPVHTLLPIKLILSLKFFTISNLTCFRINILSLGFIIQVIDTSSCLNKNIIPRDSTTEIQAFGDEVEFLLQGKVGIDTSSSSLRCTTDSKILCRVTYIGSSWIESPCAVRILWQEHIWSDVISTSPLLTNLPLTIAHVTPRSFSYAIATSHIYLQSSATCDGKVQVTTNIDTIVSIARVVVTTIVIHTEEVTLMHEISRSEVLNEFCTTTYVHVGIIGHSRLFEKCILPIHIGITFTLLIRSLVTIVVYKRLRTKI